MPSDDLRKKAKRRPMEQGDVPQSCSTDASTCCCYYEPAEGCEHSSVCCPGIWEPKCTPPVNDESRETIVVEDGHVEYVPFDGTSPFTGGGFVVNGVWVPFRNGPGTGFVPNPDEFGAPREASRGCQAWGQTLNCEWVVERGGIVANALLMSLLGVERLNIINRMEGSQTLSDWDEEDFDPTDGRWIFIEDRPVRRGAFANVPECVHISYWFLPNASDFVVDAWTYAFELASTVCCDCCESAIDWPLADMVVLPQTLCTPPNMRNDWLRGQALGGFTPVNIDQAPTW